jgi:hypothetical protein
LVSIDRRVASYRRMAPASRLGVGGVQSFAPRNSGNSAAQSATINKVPMPPSNAAQAAPNKAATAPDSNPPNSLEVPMNMPLTALTRPRITSGVATCTSV